MSKINAYFNNKNYQISKSVLEPITAEVQEDLLSITTEEGTAISFAGSSYNIDNTKLNTTSTEFTNFLNTIPGSTKLTVRGTKYSIDVNKLSVDTSEISNILQIFEIESDITEEPIARSLAPGLYNTGAITLFEEGDYEAASAMLETSWDTLVSEGAISVTGTEITSSTNTTIAGELVISNNVVTIGNKSFEWCSNLTGVVIPESVISLGEWAFNGCSSLTSINIPDSVTSVGKYAFYSCSSLASIIIPESVTSINDNIFSNCGSLTSVIIPDSITSIGFGAFSNCESLTSIEIPDSITSIGNSAFSGCFSLSSVVIPDSVTSIGNYTFQNCRALTDIAIPNSVINIGNSAFYYCKSLNEISFNGTIAQWNSITKGTTWNYNVPATYVQCTNGKVSMDGNIIEEETPEEPELPEEPTSTAGLYQDGILVKTWEELLAEYFIIVEDNCVGCGIKDIVGHLVIPDNININTLIVRAFQNQINLTSIEIPASVTSIGDYAFFKCSGLTNVSIGSGVTSIGNYAFSGCTSLTSIVIPKGVTSIGNFAFISCSGLADLTFEGTVAQWSSISKGTYWNGSILATYVQCSDGQVAL